MSGCLNLQNFLPIVKKFCRCVNLKNVEGSAEDFGRLYDNKNDAVVEFLLCGCGESFCGGGLDGHGNPESAVCSHWRGSAFVLSFWSKRDGNVRPIFAGESP